MTPYNNLSVLPFYTSIEQQNARKWWLYDRVYPLFTPGGFLPSFQIIMPKEPGSIKTGTFSRVSSLWEPRVATPTRTRPTVRIGGDAYRMNNIILELGDFSPNDDNCIIKFDAPYFHLYAQGEIEFGIRTADGAYIERIEFVGWAPETQGELAPDEPGEMDNVNGVFTPTGKTNNIYFTVNGGINFNSIVVTFADKAILRDSKGTAIMDITDELDGVVYYKVIGDNGILIYNNDRVLASLDNGQYYIDLIYNGYRFYSDIFTIVNDISGYLKLEWWDDADFIMDAGAIVYTNPAYKNILYLESDIAKPEYNFNEEIIERDGYTFPVKQVSEKKYRFSFLASEYMLDILRFVRMSDHVTISKNGQTFVDVDTFLITPDWQAAGDVAVVDAEFTTDTVAKKNGRGVISN